MKRSDLPVFLQYLAALLLSILMLTLAMRLWAADLGVPLAWHGDFTFGLGQVKSILQTGWIYQAPRLGAPFGATTYDFPLPENLLIAMLRVLTLFSQNPFLVFNLFYLIGFPLTALTALYALKAFKLPFYLALPGALAVAFLPYHFLRINHTLLSEYFMMPLVLMVAVRVMQGELEIFTWDVKARSFALAWRNRGTWAALLICVLTASTGVYYAVFSAFILGIAALKCLLAEWKTLRFSGSLTGMALAVLLGGVLVVNMSPYLLYNSAQPALPDTPLPRSPGETEFYGLKLIQMLLPRPDHQIALLGRMNTFYQAEFGDENENNFASLGLIGALGFLASLGVLVKAGHSQDEPLQSLSVLNLACFLLGTVGGFAAIVSFLITPEIRSVNRISVLIGFVSIAVFCLLLQRLLRFAAGLLRAHRRQVVVALKVALVIALLGVIYVDQCGQPVSNAEYAALRADFSNDRAFIQSIETSLPRGAQIFELPYLPFPEGGSIHYLTDYDQLKPYLLSDGLRWNFGGTRERLADTWNEAASRLPVENMLQTLAAAGFAGIYVNRDGYDPAALDAALENELVRLTGSQPRVDGNQTRAFFDLRAYAAAYQAKFSPADWAQQVNQTLFPVYRNVALSYTGQFYAADSPDKGSIRRSGKASGMLLQNLSAQDQTILLSFDVATTTNKPANLSVASSFWTKTYPIDGKFRTLQREVTLSAGQKLAISFTCDGDPYLLADGNPRPVIFQISQVSYSYKN